MSLGQGPKGGARGRRPGAQPASCRRCFSDNGEVGGEGRRPRDSAPPGLPSLANTTPDPGCLLQAGQQPWKSGVSHCDHERIVSSVPTCRYRSERFSVIPNNRAKRGRRGTSGVSLGQGPKGGARGRRPGAQPASCRRCFSDNGEVGGEGRRPRDSAPPGLPSLANTTPDPGCLLQAGQQPWKSGVSHCDHERIVSSVPTCRSPSLHVVFIRHRVEKMGSRTRE